MPALVAVAALLAAASSLGEAYGRLYTALPRSDQWRFVADLRDATDGFAVQDLLRLQNENRPAVPRLFHFLDAWLLGGRNLLPLAVTLVAQLATLGLLAGVLRSLAGRRGRGAQWWLLPLAVAGVFTFSAAQLQTYEWGFQVALAGGFALGTASVASAWRAAEARGRGQALWLALAAAAAALAELSFQGGLVAWPAALLLAAGLGVDRRLVAGFALLALTAVALYFFDYAQPAFASSPGEALRQPLDVGVYLLAYLGNPFGAWHAGVAATLGGMSLALLALALLPLLRGRTREGEVLALAAIALFALGEALLRASQRADFPAEHATGAAFAVGPALYWSALVALLWACARGTDRPGVARALAAYAAAAVAIVAAGWSWATVRDDFERAQDSYRASEVALLAGVYDYGALSAIYPPESLNELIALVPFLRAEGYSVFSGRDDGELVGQLASDAFVYTTPELCLGFFDTRSPATGVAGEQVNGWAWIPRSRATFERVVLVNGEGRIVGLAAGGYPRPDVPRDNRRIDSELVGWRGFMLPGQTGVRALGVFGDGGACELEGRPGPP